MEAVGVLNVKFVKWIGGLDPGTSLFFEIAHKPLGIFRSSGVENISREILGIAS